MKTYVWCLVAAALCFWAWLDPLAAAVSLPLLGALTNAGRDDICKKILGESSTVFDNTNAYLGVGDSTTAFAAGQTDLQASTNKLRKAMDASYPQRSGNVLTFRSTFGSSEANFAWEEFGTFNASSAGVMLQRKVQSLGTKSSGQTWEFTVTNTVTAA